MKNVQLSVDKIAVEYHGVTVKFYNQLALSFRDWFDIRPAIRHKGYVYHWSLGIEDAYLYLRYQPWRQKKSRKYSLQIETHADKEVNSALSYNERMSNATTQKSDSWDAYCIADGRTTSTSVG
ncbi:hypothetical protein RW092_13375 [Paenibacillus sp. 3LSP]|uniref:hypothetical protein n=1 Tax=Paenibacillus sp. 3LSP TaxID=2800795 RepID=UPI0028FD4153|nr:hypothetical protein [Paenibacillus sp. 3LSP]MDU0331178.1 hypothetical protein [Paenibacillus sp. 3LSP]